MKCFRYTNDLGTEIDEIEIPDDHKERAEEARAQLSRSCCRKQR